MDLTEEERGVIDEYVAGAKKNSKEKMVVIRANEVGKAMKYNFIHGKGASFELLFKALPFIKENYDLTEKEFDFLARKAKQRHKYDIWHWDYQKERPIVKPEQIVTEGENYLILVGGIRIDYGFDYYEQVRGEFIKTGKYDPGMN